VIGNLPIRAHHGRIERGRISELKKKEREKMSRAKAGARHVRTINQWQGGMKKLSKGMGDSLHISNRRR